MEIIILFTITLILFGVIELVKDFCPCKVVHFISLVIIVAIFSFAHYELGKMKVMTGDKQDYIDYKLKRIFIFSSILIILLIIINLAML